MTLLTVSIMASAPGTASDPWTKSCCISTTIRAGTKLGVEPLSMAMVDMIVVYIK